MRTLDRYIIAKTLWPLVATIGIAMLALLLERTVRLLDLVVTEGGPLYLVLRMLANLIPHYLGIALPAAFFVGILLTAMQLSGDNELDAIHAFGVSLRRVVTPILGLAVILVVASTLIIGFLQPYTRYGYRALVYLLTNTAWDAAIERGAFFNGFGNITVTVNSISQGGSRLEGVFVHETRPDGGSTTTSAAEGEVLRSTEDFRLILKMGHGIRIESEGTGGKTTILTFDHFDLPLDVEPTPEPFRPRESETELTLPELWQAHQRPPPGVNPWEVLAEFHSRLVRIVSLVFLPLLAVPLGMAVRRAARGVGFVAGLALVVLYHYVLQFGEALADGNRVSVWLGLWCPFLVFAGISIVGFHFASTRPGENPISVAFETIQEWLSRLWSSTFARRRMA